MKEYKRIRRYSFRGNQEGAQDLGHPANKQWEHLDPGNIVQVDLAQGSALAVVSETHRCVKCILSPDCTKHYGAWCLCCIPLEDIL